jgi:hypothetical protein
MNSSEEIPLLPDSIVNSIVTCASDNETIIAFSNEVEKYMLDLIQNLISYRSQNSLVRDSIVAVPGSSSIGTIGTMTTRDACRTLKKFSGISIPDVTSILRVTTGPSLTADQHATSSVSLTPSGTPTIGLGGSLGDGIDEIGAAGAGGLDSTATVGVGIGSLISKKKASNQSAIVLPPRQPKKRGRPSNKDRGLPPPPKKQQH